MRGRALSRPLSRARADAELSEKLLMEGTGGDLRSAAQAGDVFTGATPVEAQALAAGSGGAKGTDVNVAAWRRWKRLQGGRRGRR